MSPRPKTKTRGANLPVPQSRDEAAHYVREIGDLRRAVVRCETAMNDEIALIKEFYDLRAAPMREGIERRVEGLKMWAEANRDALTQNGRTKTVDLGTGQIAWRSRPPKVTIRGGIEMLVETLRRLGLQRFVRVKEEPNREAMLAEPDVARTVPGVAIGSEGEDFVVEPLEVELAA
jgi:phage host-nuclease inhibitor protein Gam